MIGATYSTLPLGSTSTIRYQVTLNQSVAPGQTLTNGVVETWTSLPGNPGQISPLNPNSVQRTGNPTDPGQLNNYRATASAPVNVIRPSLVKTLVGTSIVSARDSNTQAVIGERVNYTITVTIPQGTTPAADLIDQMPAGLAFVQMNTPSFVISNPAAVSFTGTPVPPTVSNQGQLLDFALGTITNTDTNSAVAETITFNIQAVVLNVTANVQGTLLVNQAAFDWNNKSSTTGLVSSPAVTVIEPKMLTTKAVTIGGNGGNPGDPVTYTIRIQQDPTSAADAFNVTVNDPFPTGPGGSIISGLTLANVTDTSGLVTAANFALTGSDATGYTLSTTGTGFDFPKNPAGRVITLTFTGTTNTNVQPAQTVTNTDEVEWTSLPGSPGQISTFNPNAFERTGNATDPGQLNNYLVSSSASFTVRSADLAVVKTVNNPTPNVGNVVVFTVTLTNNGPNVAHQVTLTDKLPSGLAFVSDTPSQGTYSSATGIWNVGTVAVGAANAETLRISARVTVPTARTNDASITNSAELDPNTGNNQDSATVTPQIADVFVLKTVSDPTPNVGDIITYTVTLGNNGPDTATNVRVQDTLPVLVPITILSVIPAPGTSFANNVWSVPSIIVGTTKTLLITARVNGPGLGPNLVVITHSDQFDPNLLNNVAITAIDPLQADLAVLKTVDDPAPQVGGTITYTVTLVNLGPNTATNVALTDTLPASGFTVTNTSVSTGSFAAGVWTIASMPVGDVEKLTITGTVDTPVPPAVPVPLTNTATVTHSDQFDPNTGNNSDSATAVPQYADLSISKMVDNPTPDVGATVNFTITVTNLGPNTALQAQVADLLPPGLTFVSARPFVGSYDPNTGIWMVGDVPDSAVEKLIITATVDNPGAGNIPAPVTNTATVSSPTYDPDPTNNTSSVTVTPPYADLAVQKTVDDPTPNVGDVVNFTVTLTNLGKDSAKNVKVTDLLPAGLTFVSATPSQGSYRAATGIWTVGTVDTLFPRTLVIAARVASPRPPALPQPQINTATVKSTTYDPDPTNNSASATVMAQYADLAVTKIVSNPRPNVGDTITWTVTLTNLGVDAATNVTIADRLPPGVTLISAVPTMGSYDAVAGVWTVGTMAPQDVEELVFTTLVVAGTAQTNVAQVLHSDQYDPNPLNNRASVTETPLSADLAVFKMVDNPHPVLSTTVTYTLIVRDLGPDTAVNVMVADIFPPGTLTPVGPANLSQGTFDPVTGIWIVGDLASGVTATLTVTARVNVVAPIVNTEVASSVTFDPNLSNNTSRAVVDVLPPFPSKRSFLAN
jgi:uncharacterized repeat protein (TIGR01451 family)/fimbrial isopeptide formation D2 family protein